MSTKYYESTSKENKIEGRVRLTGTAGGWWSEGSGIEARAVSN